MQYIRRLLWFIASRLLIFTFIVSLLLMAFFMAMNMASIYVLLSDGMEARTEMVLTRDTRTELSSYFRDEFLSADQTLKIALSESSPWQDYAISKWNHELMVNWMWSWPWEDVARATITEHVTGITGTVVPQSQALANAGLIAKTPPTWQGGQYAVTLLRANGQWKISGLVQTRIDLPEETPVPANAG